jgi:hypothetical protein
MPETFIKIFESNETNFYVHFTKKAFAKCLENNSKLPEWILSIDGMSGKKYRHFINNLVSFIPNCRYLEIGSWMGSTLCSSTYKNDVYAKCIENWSQFGGPKQSFEENIKKCISESFEISNIQFELDEKSYLDVDYSSIGKYNLYFFDGPHDTYDQYNAISMVLDALDDEFIFICDDWNWAGVREETKRSFDDFNLNVLYSLEIRSTFDDTHPPDEYARERGDWHNGYYIAVCRKNNCQVVA